MTSRLRTYSRRSALKLAAAAPLIGAPSLLRAQAGKSVSIFDGGGAQSEALKAAYFEPFEKETGIKVIQTPRTPEAVIRASIIAGVPKYDVISFTGSFAPSFASDGLLLPIDFSLWGDVRKEDFAPAPVTDFTVPNYIYSIIVAFTQTAGTSANTPGSWADVWDTERFKGGRTLASGSLGSGCATFECALLADGVPPEKLYPLDMDRAVKSLERIQKSVVKWWVGGAEPVQMMVDGNASIGSAWNGRIEPIRKQGGSISMTWNQGIMQYATWAVPKGAKNAENAMRFVAFSARPDRQAAYSRAIDYGPTNKRAYEHIPKDRALILPTAPDIGPKQVVQDYAWWSAKLPSGKTNDMAASELWERWVVRK